MTCYPRQILRRERDFTIQPLIFKPRPCFKCGKPVYRSRNDRSHSLCKNCITSEVAAMYDAIRRTKRVSSYYEEGKT